MNREFTFFSAAVTEGHPDKLCDQISDAIVGLHLRQDPLARISAECSVAGGILFVAVRFRSEASLDIPTTVREVVQDVGYDREDFNARSCTVMTSLAEIGGFESRARAELAPTEANLDDLPALDQAAVFGYACRHTPTFMPLPVWLSQCLTRRVDEVRKSGALPYLAPEAKAQVGVHFRNRRPSSLYSVTLIACQLEKDAPSLEQLRRDLRETVVEPVLREQGFDPNEVERIDINPGGAVIRGGPTVHAGLTGRKTSEDTYGDYARHAQAALSGKDPSRVARVGAYAARHAAKNIVAAGLADECEVQLTYSIGSSGPISIEVNTFDSGKLPELEIVSRLRSSFDFRIASLAREFELRRLPQRSPDGYYRKLAVYGQMGREDLDAPWERLDRKDALT